MIGIVLVVVGAALALGFWPLTSVSGAQLLAAHQGGGWVGYPVGSRITIHEKVLAVAYLLGNTIVEIEDGNPDVLTAFTVRGDARGAVPVNAAVYASAVLQAYFGALVLWEVASPGDVHLSWPVDVAFYLVLGLGILVLAVAAFRKRAPGGR